jgi:adenosine deaminase
MWEVLEYLRPERVGHGILCATDERLIEAVKRQNVTLEICPTSNLRTRAVRDLAELRQIIRTLRERSVAFTINTDGPEMLLTNLVREYRLLLSEGILTEDEARECMAHATKASFLSRYCLV